MKCDSELMLNDWIDIIQRYGYLTGTACYGPVTEESDIDYVMTEIAVALLAPQGMDTWRCGQYALAFMSFKYRRDEGHRWINLIMVPDELALNAWKHATNNIGCVVDKKERQLRFGRLLNQYFRDNNSPDRAIWRDV